MAQKDRSEPVEQCALEWFREEVGEHHISRTGADGKCCFATRDRENRDSRDRAFRDRGNA